MLFYPIFSFPDKLLCKMLILLFCVVGGAGAQSVIDQIGWKGASGPVVVSFFLALAALLGFLAAYYSYKRLKEKEDSAKLDRCRFLDTAKSIGLTETEVACVKELIKHEPSLQPQLILQSVSVFEKCVDRHVSMLLSGRPEDDEIDKVDRLIGSIRRKAGFHHLHNEHPLISTRNISIGQTGSIFGKDHRLPIVGKATVVDSNEFMFTLEYNTKREDYLDISSGDVLKFAFSRKQDGMYGLALRIAKADNDGLLSAYHTMELKRNQLRKYVRVAVNFPIRFRLIRTADVDNSEIKRGEQVEGKLLDLSGGGISFICERSLRPGDLISTAFNIPGASFSGVACKILRIGLQEGKTTTYYRHHGQFVNFEEQRKRDQIIKYVFEKQRQQNQWR